MPGNIIAGQGNFPIAEQVTLTGVAAVTMSSYAATGTVNGVPNIVTITASGAHGLGAMISLCSNIATTAGVNSGKNWGTYDWTVGASNAATSLPNPSRCMLTVPQYPWLGVTMSADATVAITGGSYLVVAVPSTTTFQIAMSNAVFLKWTGALAGAPTITPFIVLGPGKYITNLGANTLLQFGATTTNAAGTAVSADTYIPGAVNSVVTGAIVGTVTPGTAIPFFNGGVAIGSTTAAATAATGNATKVMAQFDTDGALFQINPTGAGTTFITKYK